MLDDSVPGMSLSADTTARAARASEDRRDTWMGMEAGSTMGLELLVAICLWAALGGLVDRWLGTSHWFLAIGALIGNFAGIYLIWLRSERMNADEDARRDRRQDEEAARRREGSADLVR